MQNYALERRLARLESTQRYLGTALTAALAALAFLLLGGAAPQDDPVPRPVRASSVDLFDAAGVVRARLGFDAEGAPGLFLYDERGPTEGERLFVKHAEELTGMYVRDETGTVRIGVAQFAHGGGGVALHGPESKGAAVLYYKETGSLRLYDEDGTITSQVPQPR